MSRWISLKRRQLVQQVNALASTILMRSFSGGVESCFLKNSTDLKDVLMCCKLKIHKSQMIADRHAKNQNVVEEKQRLWISKAWLCRRPSVTSEWVRRGQGEVQRDEELIQENIHVIPSWISLTISPIFHILAACPYHDQPQIAGPRIRVS